MLLSKEDRMWNSKAIYEYLPLSILAWKELAIQCALKQQYYCDGGGGVGHIPTAAKMGLLGGFLERLENNGLARVSTRLVTARKAVFLGQATTSWSCRLPSITGRPAWSLTGQWEDSTRQEAEGGLAIKEVYPLSSRPPPAPQHAAAAVQGPCP